MPIESAADRLAYLTEFGVGVVFDLGIENWDAKAIFDGEFIDINGIESRRPVLLCRFDDIYQPGQLQKIEFRATSVQGAFGGYNIVEVREDGTGMVELGLELQ